MKKLLVVLSIASIFALSSCSKCGTCEGSGTSLDGVEYCKGNSVEDAAHAFAESECKNQGGTFN